MTEISLKDLYSTNKRKLGEILYTSTLPGDPDNSLEGFLGCRLPALSILPDTGGLTFQSNALESHVPLCASAAIPTDEW